MGESVIVKGMELLELNGRDASRCIRRICVEGYDTSFRSVDLDTVLRKKFASCGEIIHVSIPREDIYSPICRFAFIYLRGEGAEEKALKLSGSDAGGWKVVAKACPFEETYPIKDIGQMIGQRMIVTGFDTSLPEEDIKNMLIKRFLSSGDETDVIILPTKCTAIVYIRGEDAVEKALQLSGRDDVGGFNCVVLKVMPPFKGRMGYSTRPSFEKVMAMRKKIKPTE